MTISIITTSNHTHLADGLRYMKTACGRRVDAPRRTDGALSPLRGLLGTADSRDAVTCRACCRTSAFHRADPARAELEASHADAMVTLDSLRSYLRYSMPSERESIAKMMPGAQYVIDLDARLQAEADKRDAEAAQARAERRSEGGWQSVGRARPGSISSWVNRAFGVSNGAVVYNGRGISFPTLSVSPEYRLVDPWA